jgi:hypothetical protein
MVCLRAARSRHCDNNKSTGTATGHTPALLYPIKHWPHSAKDNAEHRPIPEADRDTGGGRTAHLLKRHALAMPLVVVGCLVVRGREFPLLSRLPRTPPHRALEEHVDGQPPGHLHGR